MTPFDVLMIDNLDSFTFNLVESLHALGAKVKTFRNTASCDRILEEAQRAVRPVIVLSPGPGGPREAGVCPELVRRARGRVGVVGICLGHQVLLDVGGVAVGRAPQPVHGETALLEHDGTGPFAGLPSPLRVGRYHSLGGAQVPEGFTAHGSLDGVVYGMSSVVHRAVGLQFHPESILTPQGDALLERALAFAADPSAPFAAQEPRA